MLTFEQCLTEPEFAESAASADGYGGGNFVGEVATVWQAMTGEGDHSRLILDWVCDGDGIIDGASLLAPIWINRRHLYLSRVLDWKDLTDDRTAAGVAAYAAIHAALAWAADELDTAVAVLLDTGAASLDLSPVGVGS